MHSFKDDHRRYIYSSLLRIQNLTLVSPNDLVNVNTGGIKRSGWGNLGGCSLHDSVQGFIKDAPYLIDFEATLDGIIGDKAGFILASSTADCGWSFSIVAVIWDRRLHLCFCTDYKQTGYGWEYAVENGLSTDRKCMRGKSLNAPNKLKIVKRGNTVTATASKDTAVQDVVTFSNCYVSKISGYPGVSLGGGTLVKSIEIKSFICLPGYYDAQLNGTSLLCHACVAGTYSDGSTYCKQCPLGSISGAAAEGCKQCPSGYITLTPGSSSCTACSPGINIFFADDHI